MTVVEREFQIDAPISRVFAVWRDFTQFDEMLPGVLSVKPLSDTKSEWTVRAPFNTTVMFIAETTEIRENAYMHWQSTHGAGQEDVTSGGELFFEAGDADNTTRIRFRFQYDIPSSSAERVIATLRSLGYPDREFDQNLAILKELIEKG